MDGVESCAERNCGLCESCLGVSEGGNGKPLCYAAERGVA